MKKKKSKNKKKLPKYMEGGALAQSGANIASGAVYNLALQGVGNLANALQTGPYDPINPTRDGTAMYREGGNTSHPDSQKIEGPSHDQGGVPLTSEGQQTPSPELEAEGEEDIITLSDKSKYILPKDSIESYMAEQAKKLYSDDTDPTELNALRFVHDRLAKANDQKKAAKEAAQQQSAQINEQIGGALEAKYGGSLKKFMAGGATNSPLDLNALHNIQGLANNFVAGPPSSAAQPKVSDSTLTPSEVDTTLPQIQAPIYTPDNQKNPITHGQASDIIKGTITGADLLKGALATPDHVNPRLTDYSQADRHFQALSSDSTQQRQDAIAASNAANSAIENSTRSLPAQHALKSNNYANLGDALNRVENHERDVRNQINSQLGQYESTKAQDEARKLFQADQLFAQNEGAVDAQRERALDTLNNYGKDLSNKQFAADMLANKIDIAQLKTAEGFALLEHFAEDFELTGKEAWLKYQQNPTEANKKAVIEEANKVIGKKQNN